MRRIRISVNGRLPGYVLYGALISLIQFRRRIRKLVAEEFPGEHSMTTINRLAKVHRDVDELEYWEQSPREQIEAHFGSDTDAALQRLNDSHTYFVGPDCSVKRFKLIVLCEAVNRYFRVARATEPADWDRANEIQDDETIPFFDSELEEIEDFLFALRLETELLLRLAYVHGLTLGEIEGMQLRAVAVAAAGGAARARKLKATEDHARVQIQKYIAKHRKEQQSTDPQNPRNSSRKLSASSVASAMIYGDMSELGHRTLANLASEELAALRNG